jgi:ATP-binding cassette, subfamily B, bacterial
METNTVDNINACHAGSDTTPSDEKFLYSLNTSIDLAGRACPERLDIFKNYLAVRNGAPGFPRNWRFDQVEAFRLEPTIGSCFLQAQVDKRWVDVLRISGGVDQKLTDLAGQLNARCHAGKSCNMMGQAGIITNNGDPTALSSDSNTPESDRARHLRTTARILSMLRPFRHSVVLLLALSLGVVAIELVPPMLLGLLVDRVFKVNLPNNSQEQLLLYLFAIVAGLLLVRLAAAVMTIWKGAVASRLGPSMTANLRDDLVKKLNELPLAFHDRNQVGMLMSQVAYDTETLHTFVYHMTSGFLLQTLQLAGISVWLIYLNAKLALITLLPMPLIIAGSWYFTRYLQPRYRHYWEAVGKQAAALKGMLSGIRVVKSFVQEDREIRRFSQSSRRLRDSRMTVDVSTSTFTASMGLLFALGTLAVWYIGGRDVLSGTMTLGSLMAFLFYLAMFYTPLTSIAESTTWFANFFSINRRICDLLDVPSELESPQPAALPDRFRGSVEFRYVSFGYDKSRPVLKKVSFAIRPGEMIGVVGRSGSGKSTLVSLIGRLYESDSGQILLDGVDVRQISLRRLRRQIGMVPQEPFLFRGPVADNIAYGDSQAAPERVILAAKQADAHEFIMQTPFAYETQLGEGGAGLSGGERQRISIARALLFDPDILILDEATASVDAEAERAICNAIKKGSRHRTTIVVAHRLSTLQDSDRLLVFDEGRLIEQGTPQDLFAQGGLYASLARIQGNPINNLRRDKTRIVVPATLDNDGSSIDQSLDYAILSQFQQNDSDPGISSHNLGGDGDLDGACRADWLNPAAVTIAGDKDGMLRVIFGKRTEVDIYAVRAFPGIHDREYISLRRRGMSGRGSEAGMIDSLDRWPLAAQKAILRSLDRRYLLRPIFEIRQLRTKGNLLEMSVFIDSGLNKIYLDKPGEGCQSFGKGGLLLTDAGGNYYVIFDRYKLPKHQQRLLNLYFGD